MAGSYTAVLLLDTAGPEPRLAALRLLNYLGCRLGPGRLRWGSRCFDSQGTRGRPSRLCRFRELGPRGWEELEAELLARERPSRVQPAPPAALTHTALKEVLLDYPWDRPDITSPAKAAGRGQRPAGPPRSPSLHGHNAVFLLAPCPRSRVQLRRFLCGAAGEEAAPLEQLLRERLLTPPLRDLLTSRSVALYWMDTGERQQVCDLPDHVGYWTVSEQIELVGGKILPFETLIQSSSKEDQTRLGGANNSLCKVHSGPFEFQSSPCIPDLPFDSVLNCLLCNEMVYRASFPQQDGTLCFMAHGMQGQWDCPVVLDPISLNQRYLQSPVTITLKGTVKDWSFENACTFSTDSWVLQHSKEQDTEKTGDLLLQLLRRLAAEHLHMVADVSTCEDLSPNTGILTPVSDSVAVLTVISTAKAVGIEKLFTRGAVTDTTEDVGADLPDIVNSVLSHVYNEVEDNLPRSEDVRVPDWARQELARTSGWNSSVVEGWYPFSNVCGASSDLMESFRLLHAVTVDEKEESYGSNLDLTENLSELYQKQSSEESGTAGKGENKKRRGGPRTPVRQKMKTMCRSLQMLNVARLNVKAQKCQQDEQSQPLIEKGSQKPLRRRSSNKLEEKGKSKGSVDLKTEKEVLSFIIEDYQKTVKGGLSLSSCAQNTIAVIKTYLKSNDTESLEVDCIQIIQSNLLKTGKAIRQQFGTNQDKEGKVRECQIQIFLRLEMCLQCTSIQKNPDAMELVVEEMTDMLRILSLTEDPAYLTTFLEEVLDLYISSIPKILGSLYFSLGTQIPEKLASALPSDFFSDNSMTQESKSPTLSQPPVSTAPSAASVSTEADQLEELRTRSAKKRRKISLARHRSVTETAQNLRQIELPKVPKRQMKRDNSHTYLAVVVEKLQIPLVPAQPKKEAIQEVTKVRRNLFNREILSPGKRSAKMPRSQSVSAVEGMKHKRSLSYDSSKDHHTLLTKKVTETPLHKQVSNRLLHKQIKGRGSHSGLEIAIVEESPEKPVNEVNLRRSPRIKQLSISRRHSSSFYSFGQPKSRNLERLHSASQLQMSTECTGGMLLPGAQMLKSPKRLLFGAVLGMDSPPGTKKLQRNQSCSEEPVIYQTPIKASQEHKNPVIGNMIVRKSPRVPRTPCRTPKKLENASKSPAAQKTAAKSLGKYFSPKAGETSPAKSTERRSDRLAQITPQKNNFAMESFSSPFKNAGHLQSCEETFAVFRSPSSTSRKASNGEITPAKSKNRMPELEKSASKDLDSNVQSFCTPRRHSLRTPQKPETTLVSVTSANTRISHLAKSPAKTLGTNMEGQCTPGKSALRFPHIPERLSTSSSPAKNTSPLPTSSATVLETYLQGMCTPSMSSVITPQKPKTIPASSSPANNTSPLAPSPAKVLVINLQDLCTPSMRPPQKPETLSASSTPTKDNIIQLLKSPTKILKVNLQNLCTPRKNDMTTPHKPETLQTSSTPTKIGGLQLSKTPVKVWDTNMQDLCTPQKSYKRTPQKLTMSATSTPSKGLQVDYVMVSPAPFFTPRKFKVVSPRTPSSLLNPALSSPLKASLRSWSLLSSPPNEVSNSLKLLTSKVVLDSDYSSGINTAVQIQSSFDTLKKSTELENVAIESNGSIQTPVFLRKSAEEQEYIKSEGNAFPLWHAKDVSEEGKLSAENIFHKKQPLRTSEPSGKVMAGRTFSPRKYGKALERSISSQNSSRAYGEITSEVLVVCERLDSSSLASSSTSESLTSSQTEESIDISEARVLPGEGSGLKMKLLVTRKHSSSDAVNSLATITKSEGIPGDLFSTPSYELRCTPDRRQRKAAARLGTPDFPTNFSTPKSQRKPVPAGTPTYEVELEMQASGLPKLRIKRTDSCSTPDINSGQKKTPTVPRKHIGDESPFSEPNSPWCGRPTNKVESVCVSPSCFRSSHNTPGKSGMQTYICQSYTPTRCTSNTTSPCRTDVGVPWTPSPKHKEKTTDAIKNWPRRKKAAAICTNMSGKSERNQDCVDTVPIIEGEREVAISGNSSNKSVLLGEFELEGVYRLQDQSPVADCDFVAEETTSMGNFGLKSRKRKHECLSSEKLTQELPCLSKQWDLDRVKGSVKDQVGTDEVPDSFFSSMNMSSSNTSFPQQSSLDDDVFGIAGLTPPNKIVRSSLSASGLLALTHSPLLFQGKTPSSKRKAQQDEETDLETPTEKKVALGSVAEKEESPFSRGLSRRAIRTYTRKKLLG